MAQLLEAINRLCDQCSFGPPAPQTQGVRSSTEPDIQESPAPSTASQNKTYEPRMKNIPQFDNKKGGIQYNVWKQKILDKFEDDKPQFSSERSFMRYLFNRTKGDVSKYLLPRYSTDPSNPNPFTTYTDMVCVSGFDLPHPFRRARC